MLTDILDVEEIELLAEASRAKLESYVSLSTKTTEELREENAQLKARCERSSFQLEVALSEHRAQITALEDACEKAKQQAAQLASELGTCRVELEGSKAATAATKADMELSKRNLEQVTKEKLELLQAMEKRTQELSSLNERVEALQSELSTSQQQQREQAVRLEELQLQLLTAQHAEKRLQQERELIQAQLEELREEASTHRQEAAQLRRSKAGLTLDLQAQLDHQKEQVNSLTRQLESWRSSVTEMEERSRTTAALLDEAREAKTNLETHFQNELQAQRRLVDMHKELSESRRQRIDELVATLEEMQALLLETRAAAERSQEALKECQASHEQELAKREAAIEALRKELQLANCLLEGKGSIVEKLFPAAHVSGLARESGLSLTELLSERLEQQRALAQAIREKEALQQQLSELSQELADKVPIVARHMQEYEKCVSSVATLREQLTSALVEQEQRAHERDEARAALAHAERELCRWQQQAKDLSRQVCALVREVEDARGGDVSMSQEQEISSSNEDASPPITASEVISKHLVTFRNIEELQQKNAELLAVVRELSEKQEEEEKKVAEERSSEIRERLEGVMAQLQELEQERNRQMALVASMARQRDMYRALLTSSGRKDIELPPPMEDESIFEPQAASTPAVGGKRTPDQLPGKPSRPGPQDPKAALAELQQEFDTYKKEMAENHRMVTEQLSAAREETLQLRLDVARKEAELTHVQERLKLAQNSLEPLQQEAATLRERSHHLGDNLVQHQQALTTLRQELSSAQEVASRAEVLLESARAERDQLRETNLRLERDLESLRHEKGSQARILNNLQTLQLNLERMDSERNAADQAKMSHLELRCESLQRQLEAQAEQQASLAAAWERQLREAQERAVAEAERSRKSTDELVDAYAQLHQARQELCEKQSHLARSEASAESAEVSSLRSLLTKTQEKVKELQAELQAVQQHSESLQAVCTQAEARLAEQDTLSGHCREALEQVQQAKRDLEDKVAQLEQQCHELANEKVRLLEENKAKVEDLEKQLAATRNELVEAQSKVADRARRDAEHVLDQDVQHSLVKQAQEKYEREVLLHAADIEALSATRAELDQVRQDISRLEQQAKGAEDTLTAARESWSQQEQQLRAEKDALAKRVEELSHQNSLLHQQMEMLSSQVAVLQQKTWPETPVADGAAGAVGGDRSMEQLREVVNFLRREKDLVAARAEAAEAECSRLTVQLEHRSASLRQAQQELRTEHERALARATSDAQHAELLRKVEMVQLLTESNRALRDERTELVDSKQQLEGRCAQLERELGPLREEVRSRAAQAEALQADVSFLRTEVQRWQQRTNQLLEQSSRTDPEAFRKLAEENTSLKRETHNRGEELVAVKRQLATYRDEIADYKQRLNAAAEETKAVRAELSSQIAALQRDTQKELQAVRAESDQLKAEAEKAAAELQSLRTDKEEKLKTIVQVKKIARHYRSQFEELKASKEALEKRCSELEEAQAKAETEGAQARSDLDTSVRQLQERQVSLTQELDRAKAENVQLVSEKEQANNAANQAKGLIVQARKRIADFNTKNEALTKENQTLKQNLEGLNQRITSMEQMKQETALRESSLRSQFEGRLLRQEKEMRDTRDALDRAQRQVDELTQKLNQQQQKQAKPTMVTAPVERTSGHGSGALGEPVTANVRPLTPPPQSAAALQRPGPSGARLTPTASIRPITQAARLAAVAPTAALPTATPPPEVEVQSPAVSTAPAAASLAAAATVPTVTASTAVSTAVSAAVSASVPAAASASVPAAVSASVPAAVSASVPAAVSVSVAAAVSPTPVAQQAEVQPATVVVTPVQEPTSATSDISFPGTDSGVELVVPTSTVSVTVTPSAQPAEPSTAAAPDEGPSSASGGGGAGGGGGGGGGGHKRPRDVDQEPSSSDTQSSLGSAAPRSESPLSKKLKPSVSTAEVVCTQEASSLVEPIEEGVSSSLAGTSAEEPQQSTTVDDVIVVESDDEAIEEEQPKTEQLEGAESGMEDDYEDEEMNVTCGTSRGPGEADVPEEDMAEPESLDDNERDMDDANEIEIVDLGDEVGEDNEMEEPLAEDEDVQQGSSEPVEEEEELQPAVNTSSAAEVPASLLVAPSLLQQHRPSLLPRVRNERLASSQSAAGFEEGDDSIVPSTPTLFVPRRTDGFAEAVGSPHVPHGGFVFGSASEGPSAPEPSGLSQLASQEGVGVDDTRMDLSHFEEGGGRSVPSTPLQISPTESRDTSLFQGETTVVEEPPEETPEEAAASQEEEEEGEEQPGPLVVSSPPTVLVMEAPESTEGPSSAVEVLPIVEEPAEPEESPAKAEPAVIHSSPPTIVISPVPVLEVTPEEREELLLSEGEATDTGADAGSEAQASEEPAPSGGEASVATSPGGPSQQQQQSTQQQAPPQRRRIVWEEPEPASSSVAATPPPSVAAVQAAVGGAPTSPSPAHFPSPPHAHATAPTAAAGATSGSAMASTQPQQQQMQQQQQHNRSPNMVRGLRSRRVRLRGSLPQGRGAGLQSRGAGPQGRGAGPQGRGAGPQGRGAGPQGRGAGLQGRGHPVRGAAGLMWSPNWRGGGPRSRGPHPF
ncbi:nucleoprotein TPR-like isoform X2 [Dermacentor andersoni]|uniref:nucleoprotein TPR-like isoform X2 n=1 Tax=Dermacentor andersoni TaxID=34620 RepID=UPI0024179110|nr:nucleoprotein TPR-like isoform X2 [Dermacentor andersoni]